MNCCHRAQIQLVDKIIETNTRIDALENNVKQALHEQAVRIENKHKELRAEWKRDLKDIHKKITENVNEKLNIATVSYTHLDVYKRQETEAWYILPY